MVSLPSAPKLPYAILTEVWFVQAHLSKSLFPISQVSAWQSDLTLQSSEDSELQKRIRSFFFLSSTKLITLRKIIRNFKLKMLHLLQIDSQESKRCWGMERCGTQLFILKCPKAGQDGLLTRAQQLCLCLKGTQPSPSFQLLSPSLAVHQYCLLQPFLCRNPKSRLF